MPAAIEVKARVVAGGRRAFGPGKADLLDSIAAEGSISRAAKAMEMSYSRAWQLVDTMNGAFRHPLVESSAGGLRGGGAVLTRHGEEVLALYRRLQARLDTDLAAFLPEFEKRLK
ncbi:MAG: LysR family transcriptional regulator [Alphaproteobacteria bacterium]|nr:LysR family transcriptional regulator [Alphaproteobacteria bacterium]